LNRRYHAVPVIEGHQCGKNLVECSGMLAADLDVTRHDFGFYLGPVEQNLVEIRTR
jgi:hypothetical protein